MLTRTRLIGLLAAVGLAVAPVGAQTLDAPRLTVGGALLPPVDTSVRLDDLGTSGGTLVLFSDTDGDVFERILGKSDLPATVGYTDEAETWSLLQTFTSGLTSNGLLTIGGANDLLLGTGGIRVASGSINLRNIADGANIATFGDSAIALVQPVTLSSTLAVASGTSTLTGGLLIADGSTGTPGLRFSSDLNTGLHRTGTDTLALITGGAAELTLTTTTGTFAGALAVTGDTTLTGDLAVNGNDLTSTGVLRITPTGNLTLDPTGDVVLGPTGNDILPNTGYTKNLGALSNKYLTLHAAELWVETLVAQDTIATIGGRVLVGPTTVLTADLGSGATSISVKHNQMASGDRVYLEADGKVEFMAIASAASGSGPYTYTVTRNLDGSGANDWYAGDAMFNTGTTGDGFIDLYSVSGVLSGAGPTIVGNVRTGTTYSDVAARWAIGNLNGLYGYGADTYGSAFGDPSDVFVAVDATNGVRFLEGGSTVRAQWAVNGDLTVGNTSSTNPNVAITAAGELLIRRGTTNWASLNASGLILGQISSGQGNILADTSGNMYFRSGSTTRIHLEATNGEMIFYDPSGNERVTIGNNGSIDGVTIGDHTVADRPFVQISSTAMEFCRAGVGCYLSFDGTTGNITTTGSIQVGSGGHIRGGATSFTVGTGFWIGDDSGTYKLRIGETTGGGNDYLTWSGASLAVSGTLSSQGDFNVYGDIYSPSGNNEFLIQNSTVAGTIKLAATGGLVVADSGGTSTALTVTKTVRAAGGASDCTLIFRMGVLTGGTC